MWSLKDTNGHKLKENLSVLFLQNLLQQAKKGVHSNVTVYIEIEL